MTIDLALCCRSFESNSACRVRVETKKLRHEIPAVYMLQSLTIPLVNALVYASSKEHVVSTCRVNCEGETRQYLDKTIQSIHD